MSVITNIQHIFDRTLYHFLFSGQVLILYCTNILFGYVEWGHWPNKIRLNYTGERVTIDVRNAVSSVIFLFAVLGFDSS